MRNYENPINNYITYTYIQIDPNLSKKVNYFITSGLVTSNNGYFLDEFVNYSSFNLDYWTFDLMNFSKINNKIALSRIYFTRYLDKFSRTYVKLSDLISIIMSMLKIISLFFTLKFENSFLILSHKGFSIHKSIYRTN